MTGVDSCTLHVLHLLWLQLFRKELTMISKYLHTDKEAC